MDKIIGILCTDKANLYKLHNYPNNTYLIFYFDVYKNSYEDAINFLISNHCFDIYISSSVIKNKLNDIKNKYNNVFFYLSENEIISYNSANKFIFLNFKNEKLKISKILLITMKLIHLEKMYNHKKL